MAKRKGGQRRLRKGPSPLEELQRLQREAQVQPGIGELLVPKMPPLGNVDTPLPPPPSQGKTPTRSGTKKQVAEGRLVPDPRQAEAFKRTVGSNTVEYVNIDGKTYLQAPISRSSVAWEVNFENIVREQGQQGRRFLGLVSTNADGAAVARFIDPANRTVDVEVYARTPATFIPGGPINVPDPGMPPGTELTFEPPTSGGYDSSEFRTGTYYFNKGPLWSGRKIRTNRADNP